MTNNPIKQSSYLLLPVTVLTYLLVALALCPLIPLSSPWQYDLTDLTGFANLSGLHALNSLLSPLNPGRHHIIAPSPSKGDHNPTPSSSSAFNSKKSTKTARYLHNVPYSGAVIPNNGEIAHDFGAETPHFSANVPHLGVIILRYCSFFAPMSHFFIFSIFGTFGTLGHGGQPEQAL